MAKRTKRNTKRTKRNTKKTKQTKRNTKRTKRNTKNAKQCGGFYKELDLEYVRNWKNIHKQRMDCCPCVFNLLGLDLDESNFMIGLYGGTGMKNEEIIKHFSDKYPNYSFSFIKSSEIMNITIHKIHALMDNRSIGRSEKMDKYTLFFETYQRGVERFLNDIPNNHGVVGIIYFKGKLYSHCVVFAKISNELVIYDSQVKNSIIGSEDITSYLINKEVIGLEYLMGIGKSSKYNPSSPWENLKISDEIPLMNNPSSKMPKNEPSKYYPSLFSYYPVDSVYPEMLTPEIIEDTDIFYDAIEYEKDPEEFYDASSGF